MTLLYKCARENLTCCTGAAENWFNYMWYAPLYNVNIHAFGATYYAQAE